MDLTCPKCKKTKPSSDFYKDRSRSNGFTSTCKECNKKLSNKRYHKRAKPKPALLEEKQCKDCGETFRTLSRLKLYCSQACRHRNYNRKVNPNYKPKSKPRTTTLLKVKCISVQMELKTCIWCNALFAPWHPGMKNCSKACSVAFREDNATGNHARRARYFGVQYVHIQRHLVFERDGWICQLCHQPIDPEVKYPDKRCASIDHIVPMSKGGAHVMGNLQAAHWSCNASKGNRSTRSSSLRPSSDRAPL